MLNLRTVRGPLEPAQEEAILSQYNRLTGAKISLAQFRHWIRDSPDGPAWHAILQTDDARIVGHFSLIPLRIQADDGNLVAAKTEYFFVHEDFRKEKVRGFENSITSGAILLLTQLYQNCQAAGWGPFLTSVNDKIAPFYRTVGCRPATFALSECLLILRPWQAASKTPNITHGRRIAMLLVGLGQKLLWSLSDVLFRRAYDVKIRSVTALPIRQKKRQFTFFEDKASMTWRYPEDDYVVVSSENLPQHFVIAKHGSDERFLRLCQWELESVSDPLPFLLALIDQARREKALGVRWSLYGNEQQKFLPAIRKLGFFCVERTRQVLFRGNEKALRNTGKWTLTDSFFSFDL